MSMMIGGFAVSPGTELHLRRAAKEERDEALAADERQGDWVARSWTTAHHVQAANAEVQRRADIEAQRAQLAEQKARDEREQLAEDRMHARLMTGERFHSVSDVLWPSGT